MTHDERRSERLTRLAAGELRGWAAWRLKAEIARDPKLAREWEATRQLWANLRRLSTAEMPPIWPETTTPVIQTITIGGRTMNRRHALAGLAAFSLLTVTGAVAAKEVFFDPRRDMADRSGNVWRATVPFRGEVKLYDKENKMIGSFGSDGDDSNPPITSEVVVSGVASQVKGAGRHPIYSTEGGALIGYAELKPETADERKALWAEHDRRLGIDERLHMDYGSEDGSGTARGSFGSNPRQSWTLRGVAEARFTRADNGHVVMRGLAGPVDDEMRASLKHELPPQEYERTVARSVPASPIFEWNDGTRTVRWTGFGTRSLHLTDGTVLSVEIRPYASQR